MADSGSGKYRLNSKNLFLTYPQCAMEKEDALTILMTKLKIKNYIIGREQHKDGTPHLHAYLELEKKVDIRDPSKLDLEEYHGNYQGCKNKWATMKYVRKGGDFITDMEDLEQREEAHDGHKKFLGEKLVSGVPLEQLVEEHPQLIFGYKKLKQDVEAYNLDKKTAYKGQRDNLWIYGQPGQGKSQWVDRNHPDAFRKDQSKWWDGYTGEEVVVIEDMDNNCLGHYLKIWGDHYPCSGEVKGAKVPLMHKRLIITSNYYISDIWKEDKIMAAAIARRFKVKTVKGSYEEGYELEDINTYIGY